MSYHITQTERLIFIVSAVGTFFTYHHITPAVILIFIVSAVGTFVAGHYFHKRIRES